MNTNNTTQKISKKFKPREILDETLVNMFTSLKYKNNALFYAHIIAQMNIVLDESLPAPCGVSFKIDHYNLYINESMFSEYNLDERIFILIHECLHILSGHLGLDARLKNQNQNIANIAMDCAINQLQTLPVPSTAIIPSNLFKFGTLKETPKLNKSSEYYYSIFINDKRDSKSGDTQDTQDTQDTRGKLDTQDTRGKLDTHSTWSKSEGDKDLQKVLTSQMLDKSIQGTTKQRGNLPQDIQDYINMFNTKSQVDWKKVLRGITGNKKIGKRSTIMRRARRFPNRADIKGYVKDRLFDLVVFVDISGSISTDEIIIGLNEIHHICKMNNTSMKLIQIDTEVHKVQNFDKNTKLFERSGCGGTYMGSGIKYLLDSKISYDACVFITDGFIENVSTWDKQPKGRVIWLCTTEGQEIPGIYNLPRHKQYSLKKDKGV